jgi:hypothetical protein
MKLQKVGNIAYFATVVLAAIAASCWPSPFEPPAVPGQEQLRWLTLPRSKPPPDAGLEQLRTLDSRSTKVVSLRHYVSEPILDYDRLRGCVPEVSSDVRRTQACARGSMNWESLSTSNSAPASRIR